MRTIGIAVLSIAIALVVGSPVNATQGRQAPPELAQAAAQHALRASVWNLQKENAELRAAVSERDARLASLALTAAAPALQHEQEQLAAFLRATVCGNDLVEAPIDWAQSPPVVTCPPKDRQ